MTLWFISDTHFGHANILTFLRPDGSRLRPFASVEDMDERMIEAWNDRVRTSDHIYHLGDVAMQKEALERVMPRLRGHKRLIRGNHDMCKTATYAKYFGEIHGVRVFSGIIFSHIPLHPLSLGPFRANIHGHIHANPSPPPVQKAQGWALYQNICVEHTDYAPVSLEEISANVIVGQVALDNPFPSVA